MDASRTGKYIVNAAKGLKLRKNPTKYSQIIALMEFESLVNVLAEQVQDRDGHDWCSVEYEGESGWTTSEDLVYYREHPRSSRKTSAKQGSQTTSYEFSFAGKTYTITSPNLETCLKQYIFAGTVGNDGKSILTVNNTTYWTTATNIDTMKTNKLIS